MSDGEYTAPTGMPTVFDPSFKGVGKTAGLTIWRVEKLKVAKKPAGESCYKGTFFEGDSYIILYVKATGAALEKHIYFWLGGKTSQDEQGVAAYKTVELDESMGGEAVQHREVQGSESSGFKKVFKTLHYKEGGIATGFKHVDPDAYEARLLHVKGRRKVSVTAVEVSAKSMNTGDCFIGDCGRTIVLWNGDLASHVEKLAAMQFCIDLRDDDRAGDATIHVIDRPDDDDAIFWEKLGIAKGYVEPAKPGSGDDDEFSRKQRAKRSMHRISDVAAECKELDSLKQEYLTTEAVYLVDAGNEVFVWVGRKASSTERLKSMSFAMEYIKKKGYPNSTPITRCVEEAEPAIFKHFFDVWKEEEEAVQIKKKKKSKSFLKRMMAGNAKDMHTATREEKSMVDDGSGKKTIWRIEDFKPVPVTEDENVFYSGDSYVIHYIFETEGGSTGNLMYFWQGTHTTQDEAGASAITAKDFDDEKCEGEATQIRVTQNHEPRHFLQMFKGKFVVKAGGKGSGFKNRTEKDSYDKDGTYFYRVQPEATPANQWALRTTQVPEKASSLNSLDTYILESDKKFFFWCGSASVGSEQQFARDGPVPFLTGGKDYKSIVEGKEPADFWEALGGKGDYAKVSERIAKQHREPRLFQASTAMGEYFRCEEVLHFDQTDLIEDDVMILDTYGSVYVWIGKGATTEEKKKAMETAIEYIKTDETGRDEKSTPVIVLKQGAEPPSFTGQFAAWDANRFGNGESYAAMKAATSGVEPTTAAEALQKLNVSIVPYKTLIGKDCPEGVDVAKKEQYLSDEEFKSVFKMTKADLSKLPGWKQQKLKKKAKLH